LKEIMEIVGVGHRAYFKEHYLQPLLDGGLLRLQFSDKPTHPRQRYALTDGGAKLVGRWAKKDGDPT
jgi:DNA-binding PadR family transcriptional regulator